MKDIPEYAARRSAVRGQNVRKEMQRRARSELRSDLDSPGRPTLNGSCGAGLLDESG